MFENVNILSLIFDDYRNVIKFDLIREVGVGGMT